MGFCAAGDPPVEPGIIDQDYSVGTVMLEGAQYYWFFTILMAVTAVLFGLLTPWIKDKTILQVSSLSDSGGS